jgi:hypothetical protein
MEQGWWPFPQLVLHGDSAYPLKEWLIAPKMNNLNEAKVQRFSRGHKSTRRFVENSIGIFKEKFPCLNHLRVRDPVFAANIFKCCVTLFLTRKNRLMIGFQENDSIDEAPQQDEDKNFPNLMPSIAESNS